MSRDTNRKKQPRFIRGEAYTSQASLMRHLEVIKKATEVGMPLVGEDHAVVLETLSYHPDYNTKLKTGVPQVFLGKTQYGTTCWYLGEPNGKKQEISIKQAVRGLFETIDETSDALYDFKQAARTAISPTVTKVRRELSKQESITCELTGAQLPIGEIDIDHMPPLHFDSLLYSWVTHPTTNIHPLREPLSKQSNGRLQFAIQETADDWVDFHDEHAIIRPIAKTANLQLEKPQMPWATYIKTNQQ